MTGYTDVDGLVWAARFALRQNRATAGLDSATPAALRAYRHVAATNPALAATFGAAALVAARPERWPGCRWCTADRASRVHELPTAALTAANRALLGEPCRDCLAVRRRAVAERVAAARPVVAPVPTDPATVSSAPAARRSAGRGRPAVPVAQPGGVAVGSCAVCDATARLGLTASAAPPHNRTPCLPRAVRDELRRRWRAEGSPR